MAAPILKIPVDDAAFKKFVETFEKYKGQLANQQDAWKEVNDAITEMGENIEEQIDSAARLTDEEAKRADMLRKIAEQRERDDKAQADREKEAGKRRDKAIEQVKKYAAGVANAAMSLTKWVSIDSAVALTGGMLSMWGLDRFANYAGDARKSAMGMGVGIGQMQRAGVAMSPYFDANQTIDRVANMQGDPTQWASFAMMGLNPQGKDPGELTLQAAARARSMFKKDNGNLAIAQAQGLTNIFSPEELRRMAGETDKNFNADQKMARTASLNQGLSNDTARKWQTFTQTLDNAGYSIKNQLIDKLTTLTGPLEHVEKAFVYMVSEALTRTNLDGIANGIEAFAKWLNSPEFHNGLKIFMDDIVLVAQKIAGALVLLGIVPDPSSQQHANSTGGMGRSTTPDDGFFGGFHKDDGKSFKIDSNANYQTMGRQLVAMGWSKEQAKGLLTNSIAESGLSPFAQGDKNKQTGKFEAYGLFQWHQDRRDQYAKIFHHSMESVKDMKEAMFEQTQFANIELSKGGRYARIGDQLRRMTDRGAVATTTSREYEVAGGESGDKFTESYRRGRAAKTAPEININIQDHAGVNPAVTANSAAGG